VGRVVSDLVLRTRAHDLLLWLLVATARWPKRLRHGLTSRIEADGVALVAGLARAEALRGAARLDALGDADGRLASLRALLRVGRDLGLLSAGAYEQVFDRLGEIGRLLGGWMRTERAAQGALVG
jgi:hypothetical protein